MTTSWGWSSTPTTSTTIGGTGYLSMSMWSDPEDPYCYAPQVSHYGPVDFTTETALAITPLVCFDVNGYYRELGVHWKATKGTLRKAYQALDGPNSARLTYVFKQLLNPAIRFAYDRTPLGELFIDEYVMTALKRKMMDARAARGEDTTAPDAFVEELRRHGYEASIDTPQESVDGSLEPVDDEDRPAGENRKAVPWLYAYYRLRSQMADTERLAQWQELLVQAFREKGIVQTIAVGYHGFMAKKWLVYPGGSRVIVFLGDHEQPTIEAAREASDRVVQMSARFPSS
jgi:hypothetical protein